MENSRISGDEWDSTWLTMDLIMAIIITMITFTELMKMILKIRARRVNYS